MKWNENLNFKLKMVAIINDVNRTYLPGTNQIKFVVNDKS